MITSDYSLSVLCAVVKATKKFILDDDSSEANSGSSDYQLSSSHFQELISRAKRISPMIQIALKFCWNKLIRKSDKDKAKLKNIAITSQPGSISHSKRQNRSKKKYIRNRFFLTITFVGKKINNIKKAVSTWKFVKKILFKRGIRPDRHKGGLSLMSRKGVIHKFDGLWTSQ